MFPFSARRKEEQLRQECAGWFAAHLPQLLTYARQQADKRTDVELLVTTVAANVTRAVYEGRVGIADLLPYALRSVFNAAARLREQNVRRQRTEQSYKDYTEPVTLHPAVADGPDDRQILLRRAMRGLPEELAIVVTLRIWDEQTFVSIAEQLHLPESTVRSRYNAALKHIKSKLTAT